MPEENFGAVVSLGINEFYVSKPVYALLTELQQRGTFDFDVLNDICEFNNAVEQLINNLIYAEIIYLFIPSVKQK